MKALVLTEYKKMEIRDVPMPQFGDDEVLIRVKAVGICGSDVDGYDGRTGRRQPPVIMGHEASGVIEACGAAVKGWNVGDRVTFDSTIYCNKCHYCLQGEVNLCENRRVLGVSCDDYKQDGAFAEYCVVPQHILYKLPDTVSFEQAAMVEPLSIAFHAANLIPHRISDSAVVLGTGKIGMLLVQTLRLFGFGKIYAVKRSPAHFDLIRSLGADNCFLSGEDSVREILSLTNGRGADFVFESAGNEQSFAAGLKLVRKGGNMVLVGNSAPSAAFPLQYIVTRQIRLQGSCASAGEYAACLDMIARKKIDVDSLMAACAPLEEGPQWFDRLYAGEFSGMKVILNP